MTSARSLFWIACHEPGDELCQRCRHVGAQLGDGCRHLEAMAQELARPGATGEGDSAREQFIEDAAEAVEVAANVDRVGAVAALGWHVVGRAAQFLALRAGGTDQAEIDEFDDDLRISTM